MNFSQKHMYLIVEGSQSAEFLQGQITIYVEKISDKEYTPACVCNNKGGVIATFWIKSSEMRPWLVFANYPNFIIIIYFIFIYK